MKNVKPIRRVVTRITGSAAVSDGAGVRLQRAIDGRNQPEIDPFLLFDEFRSDNPGDYLAGFPDHPHRGFETVTYMLAGRMRHRDNHGNSGLLRPGSVQWMTAGRGIVHSEMPEQEDGLMWGFQLWVNLPARDKMTAPRYQDIPPEQIPEVEIDGVKLRVIAGQVGEVQGPVNAVATEPVYLDVILPERGRYVASLPREHAAFAYVYEGRAQIGSAEDARQLRRSELAVLSPGEEVELSTEGTAGRLVLIAGRPLKEPVARYGPFVMNKPEEIHAAIADFQGGRF